jgi:hypothetical protein
MGGVFGGGGGSVKTVKPPKPIQLKLPQLQDQMVAADQAAYQQSDDYMKSFYPALTQARDQMIGQSYQNLTGPLKPTLENTFVNSANMGSINALGTGDQGFGMSTGSLARNAAAANVASNVQGYQDYNRSMFEQLNSLYAPRAFGMTPEDAANVFTFNNTQYNNYLQQLFAAQTQSYYANQGVQNAQAGATAGLVGSIGGAVVSAAIPAIIA